MKLILLLLVALAAGAVIYPRYAEHTETVCAAFEQRLNAVAQTQLRHPGKDLPPALANDPRLAGMLGLLEQAVASSRGMLAETYIHDKYPNLPPLAGCVAGYWKLTINPDLTPYLRGKFGLAR